MAIGTGASELEESTALSSQRARRTQQTTGLSTSPRSLDGVTNAGKHFQAREGQESD